MRTNATLTHRLSPLPSSRSVVLVVLVVLVRLVFRGGDHASAGGVHLDIHDRLALDHLDVVDPLPLVPLVLALRGFAAHVLLGRRDRFGQIDLGACYGERIVFGGISRVTCSDSEGGECRDCGWNEDFAFHFGAPSVTRIFAWRKGYRPRISAPLVWCNNPVMLGQ